MDELESLMEPELKEIYNEVKKELNSKWLKDQEIMPLTSISKEIVEGFCTDFNLTPPENFKKEMTTVFSIAKFIQLNNQNNEIQDRVKNELVTLINDETISWILCRDFTNTIIFTKELEINSEEKPQNLLVKYRLDNENDCIIYSLHGTWGWDISKDELKALLLHKKEINNNYSTPTKKSKEFNLIPETNGITVNVDDIVIIVKRQ